MIHLNGRRNASNKNSFLNKFQIISRSPIFIAFIEKLILGFISHPSLRSAQSIAVFKLTVKNGFLYNILNIILVHVHLNHLGYSRQHGGYSSCSYFSIHSSTWFGFAIVSLFAVGEATSTRFKFSWSRLLLQQYFFIFSYSFYSFTSFVF